MGKKSGTGHVQPGLVVFELSSSYTFTFLYIYSMFSALRLYIFKNTHGQESKGRISTETFLDFFYFSSPFHKRMGSAGVQMGCLALGVVGLIGIIVCCVVPSWRVSSFVGSNIVTAQSSQEGLWTTCVVQSTGQQQCKNFESLLQLGADRQAARALTIISGLACCISLLLLFCGADFTTCVESEDIKPKISLVAGIGILLAGILVIIPVSWSAHNTVRDFYDPMLNTSGKMELGACIFVGWAAGVLLIIAGVLLCCFSRAKHSSSGGTAKYYSNCASAPNKNYV